MTVRVPPVTALIDPAALMRIHSLELRARHIVEGLFNGLNRSPFHGFSVEFTEYRQYSPGDDDLRYLDWKLYARSDRFYIKRFEDETNLRCHLLLDLSRSMTFGSVGYTKCDYAKTLAATLAYFLTMQRDAVGLCTFDESLQAFIPARFRHGQLRRLLTALEREPGGRGTNLIEPLEAAAERVRKRGLLIFVSDLLAPLDDLSTRLRYLSARGHEVCVFQVLDPAELDFGFDQPALFLDAETGREVYIDPAQARPDYQHKLREHLARIQNSCDRLGITYRQFVTSEPLEHALSEFLLTRSNQSSRVSALPGIRASAPLAA